MSNIQDFGEKIGGARKDLYALKRELQLDDVVDWSEYDREKYITKKEAFPLPDYKKLYEEGMNREVLFFIKEIRDALPTKPEVLIPRNCSEEQKLKLVHQAQEDYIVSIGSFYKHAMNLKTINDCYNFYDQMRTEKLPSFDWYNRKLQKAIKINSSYGYHAFLTKMKKKQFLYTDREKILSNFTLFKFDGTNVSKEIYDNGKERLVIQDSHARQYIYNSNQDPSNWESNTYFALDKRTRKIVVADISSYEQLQNKVVEFESAQANQDAAHQKKKKLLPPQLSQIRPTAEDYRHGKNITGEEMMSVFQFRGGEFGNWENDNDRQTNLNMSYDALKDLAKALGIEEKDISLGGQLAIAYGARGSAGAVAHFEPGMNVINLTKMKGAGSLAHEWGHALDYYIASWDGNNTGFATEQRGGRLSKLIKTMKYNGSELTEYYKTSILLDKNFTKAGNKGYWQSDIELFARAFASYVNDKLKPASSDYLVGHSEMMGTIDVDGELKNVYVSPQGEDRNRINAAFDVLIQELKEQGILHQIDIKENMVEKERGAAVMDHTYEKDVTNVNQLDEIIEKYEKFLEIFKSDKINDFNEWRLVKAEQLRETLLDLRERLDTDSDLVAALLPNFYENANPDCFESNDLWNNAWHYLEERSLSGTQLRDINEIVNKEETKKLALSIMEDIIDYSDNRLFYFSYIRNGVVVNEDIMTHYLFTYGKIVSTLGSQTSVYMENPEVPHYSYRALLDHQEEKDTLRFYVELEDKKNFYLTADRINSYLTALDEYIKLGDVPKSMGYSTNGRDFTEVCYFDDNLFNMYGKTIIRFLRKPETEQLGILNNHLRRINNIENMARSINDYYTFLLAHAYTRIRQEQKSNAWEIRLADPDNLSSYIELYAERIYKSPSKEIPVDDYVNIKLCSFINGDEKDTGKMGLLTEKFIGNDPEYYIMDGKFFRGEMQNYILRQMCKRLVYSMNEQAEPILYMSESIEGLEVFGARILEKTEQFSPKMIVNQPDEQVIESQNQMNNQYSKFVLDHKELISEKDASRIPIVINAFGGPGSGKSVSCMDICQQLKKLGYNAEYVQEYAKELVYSEAWEQLDGSPEHQFEVLKEQLNRVDRLYGRVDFIVTDSPVLLNSVYNKALTSDYDDMVTALFNDFENFTYFVERDASAYQQEGRIQNLEESQKIDQEIKTLLTEKDIYFGIYNHATIDKIVTNAIVTFNRVNHIDEVPTNKQRAYAKKIAETLGLDLPDQETKAAYMEFINTNHEAFQNNRETSISSNEVTHNQEYYMNMVSENGNNLSEVPTEFYTPELLLAAVTNWGAAIRIVPQEFLTEKLVDAAVKQYGMNLRLIPDEFKTEKICIDAYVSSGGKSLKYVPWQLKNSVSESGNKILAEMNHIPETEYQLNISSVQDKGKSLILEIDDEQKEHELDPESMVSDIAAAARFNRYSIKNVQILLHQNKNIVYVASSKEFAKMGYHIKENEQPLIARVPVFSKYIFQNGKKIYMNQYTEQIKQEIKSGKLKEQSGVRKFEFVAKFFDISQTDCPEEEYLSVCYPTIPSEFYQEAYNAIKFFTEETLGFKVILDESKNIDLYGEFSEKGRVLRIREEADIAGTMRNLCYGIARGIISISDENYKITLAQQECYTTVLSIMLESSLGLEINSNEKERLFQAFHDYKNQEKNKKIPYEVTLEKVIDRVQSKYFNAYIGDVNYYLNQQITHIKDRSYYEKLIHDVATLDVVYGKSEDNTVIQSLVSDSADIDYKELYHNASEEIRMNNSFVPKIGIIQQEIMDSSEEYELMNVMLLNEKIVDLLVRFPEQIRAEYLALDMPNGSILAIKQNVMENPAYYKITEDKLILLDKDAVEKISRGLPEEKINVGLSIKREYEILQHLHHTDVITDEQFQRYKKLERYFGEKNSKFSTRDFMARLNIMTEDLSISNKELIKEYVFRTGNFNHAYKYCEQLKQNQASVKLMLDELHLVDTLKYMLWTIEQYEEDYSVAADKRLTTGAYNSASLPVLTEHTTSINDIKEAYKLIHKYSTADHFKNYAIIKENDRFYIADAVLKDYEPQIQISNRSFATEQEAVSYFDENIRSDNNNLMLDIDDVDILLQEDALANAVYFSNIITDEQIALYKDVASVESEAFSTIRESCVDSDRYAYVDFEKLYLYTTDSIGNIWRSPINDGSSYDFYNHLKEKDYQLCTNFTDFKAMAMNQSNNRLKAPMQQKDAYIQIMMSNHESLKDGAYLSIYDFKKEMDMLQMDLSVEQLDITYKLITKQDSEVICYIDKVDKRNVGNVYEAIYDKVREQNPALSKLIAQQYYRDQIQFNEQYLLRPLMTLPDEQKNNNVELMETVMDSNDALNKEIKKLDIAPADAEVLKLQAGRVNLDKLSVIEQQLQTNAQFMQKNQKWKEEISISD